MISSYAANPRAPRWLMWSAASPPTARWPELARAQAALDQTAPKTG